MSRDSTNINPLELPRLMLDCTGDDSGKYDLSRPFVRKGYIYGWWFQIKEG